MRKLQEEDISKTQQRAKRLAERKKNEIMEKEDADKKVASEVTRKLNKLVDIRYKNRMNIILSKVKYTKSMDHWAATGFSKTNEPSYK